MKFENLEASGCRWSEVVATNWGDWDFIWEEATVDYQGSARLLATKEGRFMYIEWSYGSCSGCDGWEDMSEEDRERDFKNMAEYFENMYELKKFKEQVNYGNGFNEAVEKYMFLIALEEKLKE
jgi:hypothetical protein